jgi:hypothetical protein
VTGSGNNYYLSICHLVLWKNISINDIQRQDNSINCGLFAIANMIEFCANEYTGNLNLQFNTKYLREHLIFCLEQGHFRPFPKLESSI